MTRYTYIEPSNILKYLRDIWKKETLVLLLIFQNQKSKTKLIF